MMDISSCIKQHTEEVLGLDVLDDLVKSKTPLKHYIGFEISGLVHLGTGLSCLMKVRDLQKAGIRCSIFLADWHTWINDKLQGDRKLIHSVAKEYFKPALEVSARIVGADPDSLKFILGTDLYHNNDRYWSSVVEISKNLTLSRILKSTSIMGRDMRKEQPFAWLLYPPMQVADIFEMGVNITHSGMDQRKVHVIAREVAPKLTINPLLTKGGKQIKPIAVHHPLLLGLQRPRTWPVPETEAKTVVRSEMKMSKSIPKSAIYIHDSEDVVKEKIMQAFCPERHIEFNPVIDWTKNLLFPLFGEITIKRPKKFGGYLHVTEFADLSARFEAGDVHPLDLKNSVADILIGVLAPAREAFAGKQMGELIEKLRVAQIA